MIKRYIMDQVNVDLQKKMVFIAGPRQVGKTTLAKAIIPENDCYLNWDIQEHREMILKYKLPHVSCWAFDEIHKYRDWRNFLKGLYDNYGDEKKILVTGSARLDYYKFSGDSLQGRYHFHRLHPLSVSELKLETNDDLMTLLKLGGFPEPFFSGSEQESTRWSREYRNLLIYDEIRELEQVVNMGKIELLALRLPDLVGSPLSIYSLVNDLQVSHKSISNWLNIFERLYSIFRIPPFGSSQLRAVKKEQKHYLYNWQLIDNNSIAFENMVACHLLKWVHYEQDTKGRYLDLKYFRDIDRREVDFVITEKMKPIMFIETKWSDTNISLGLKYLKVRFPDVESYQITATGTRSFITKHGVNVVPALDFLRRLI